jgi:hypothetical protein
VLLAGLAGSRDFAAEQLSAGTAFDLRLDRIAVGAVTRTICVQTIELGAGAPMISQRF